MSAPETYAFPISVTPYLKNDKAALEASLEEIEQPHILKKTSALESPAQAKTNLLDLGMKELCDFFVGLGEKPFRAQQVLKWIHRHGILDFSLMTDLSKALRVRLPMLCEINPPEVVQEQCSADGTRKWLIRLNDGNHIETVFIPEKDRGTLCVSSQVGCALNCSFCSTATQGFNRNLSTAEIIGQVWQAARRCQITNVVMMGMGEPLLNFESVVKALSIMREDLAYALPRRRVTLSTSGIVPHIDRLSVEADVSLAVSLHAPNDILRNRLVPLNKKYPISELMQACKRYADFRAGRQITMEYVMLRNVNDKKEDAKQLARILQGIPCKVNLIPFNPFPGTEYQTSHAEAIEAFRVILIKAGLVTTVRKTRGGDIDAACGQLVGRIQDRTRRHEKFLAKTSKQKQECHSCTE